MGCNNCYHLELKKKIDPKKIYSNYPYFSEKSPDLEKHFKNYSIFLKRYAKNGSGNYHLDIGCNDGILLKKTKKKFKTYGVEPGKKQYKLASKHGKVFNNFFSLKLIKDNSLEDKFDVITTNNTIANIKDLDDFIKAVSVALKKNGIFIVETLNLDLLLKNYVYEMFNHEHFHYFSRKSLIFLVNKYNLRFKEISYYKTKGATMRVVFEKKNNFYHSFKNENKNNIYKKKIKLFLSKLRKIKKKIDKLISQKENILGGFGSSQGTTIWVHLLKIHNKIKFVTDDNKLRHGYFVPGTKIKVIPPKSFYKINLTHTLIFAWRFATMIKKKHRTKLNNNKLVNIVNFK